jgi:nucleoid-associated protein YgaU
VGQVSVTKKETTKMNDIKQAELKVSKQVESHKVSEQKSDQPKQAHGQAGVAQPVTESRPKAAAPRTVKHGDTLTKLAEETYGKADGTVFEVIKKNNPQISNINLINAGIKIVLPAPEGQQ